MLIKVFFSYTSDDYKINFRRTTNDVIDRGSVIKKIFEIIKNNDLGMYRDIFDFYSYKDKNNTQEYYDVYIDKAKKCNALVLFPSHRYFRSESCEKELCAFLENSENKRVYPLHMDKRAKEIYTAHSRKRKSIFKQTKEIHKIELFNKDIDAIFKDTTNQLLNEKLDEITACLIKQVEDFGNVIGNSIVVASNVCNSFSDEIINKIKTCFNNVEVLAAPIFADEQLLMNQDGDLVIKRKSANEEFLKNGNKIIFFLHCSKLVAIQETLDELEMYNSENTVIIVRNNDKFDIREIFEDFIEEPAPPNWHFKDCFSQADVPLLLSDIKSIIEDD